jgi:hypothetical protein
MLALPARALADDSAQTPPQSSTDTPPSCLAADGTTTDVSLRGVRVGVKAHIRDADGRPVSATRITYCVQGGGEVSLALTPESEVVLVASTAEGDSIGRVGPTSSARTARAEFPAMKKLIRTQHSTVYRVDARRQLILGIAGGRVAYVAAADRLLLEYPGKLGYWMKRLGL